MAPLSQNGTPCESVRSNQINIAKGIAIFLVIFGHSIYQTSLEKNDPSLYWFLHRLIFSGGIPVFFFASGFLWSRGKQLSFLEQLKKDARGILYPFFALSICFEVLNIARGSEDWTHLYTATKALLLFQTDMDSLPSGVLWFLFSLFCFRQIANASRYAPQTKIINISIFSFGMLLNFFTYPTPLLGIDRLHFFLFFFLGTSPALSSAVFRPRRLYALTSLIAIIIFISLIASYFRGSVIEKLIINSQLLDIVGCITVFGFAYHINGFHSSLLKSLGSQSIYPYVFHMPAFTIAKLIAPSAIATSTILFPVFLTFSAIVITVTIGKSLTKIPPVHCFFFGKSPKS